MANFLNAKVGKPGGPPARITAASNFVTAQNESINGPTLTCRGTLETASGSIVGTVQLHLANGGTADVFSIKDSSWESDEAKIGRDAEWRQDNARARQAEQEAAKRFRGDIATWSGIPPLPASASETQFSQAVHCTVADGVDHHVTIWMTSQDCQGWIEQAKVLSRSGPTPIQVHKYRMDRCMEKFQGRIQNSSGEFYMMCARMVPSPR